MVAASSRRPAFVGFDVDAAVGGGGGAAGDVGEGADEVFAAEAVAGAVELAAGGVGDVAAEAEVPAAGGQDPAGLAGEGPRGRERLGVPRDGHRLGIDALAVGARQEEVAALEACGDVGVE